MSDEWVCLCRRNRKSARLECEIFESIPRGQQIYAIAHTRVQQSRLQSRQSCSASKPLAQVSCLRNPVKSNFAKTRKGSFTNGRAEMGNALTGLQHDRSAHRFSE